MGICDVAPVEQELDRTVSLGEGVERVSLVEHWPKVAVPKLIQLRTVLALGPASANLPLRK